MSEMSPVEAIFFAALQKRDLAERAAYLDAACRGDAELRVRVERLLAAQPQLGSFLEAPAVSQKPSEAEASAPTPPTQPPKPEPSTADVSRAADDVGTVIAGRYKLLEAIGEGGMGTVFMAEQLAPVRRMVAVKLIKAGMDSKQVLARFAAEQQALALMDHPSIARVLDAGTTNPSHDTAASGCLPSSLAPRPSSLSSSGRPFFVMELVKGMPITRFCDERRLSPRQRLELFVPVCQAVQHAHQKGIIHRDLKPSNVLVALYDGMPVPKIIDFGVAKATGQRLTDKTLFTGFGAIVGTPEYMSPEQAEVNQLDIDTRSDIYSLGVLLYELLTGSPPFDRSRFSEAALLEVLRIIREEEPPKPSTRLSTSNALPSIAANRQTEPAKLTRLVRGELDWIVMKALDKDRNRRYETASGFAADVSRYLADEAVLASPPSATYRMRKLVRKHWGGVAATGLVAATLVLAVVFSTWKAASETRAKNAAQQAKQQALAERSEAIRARDAEAEATRNADEARNLAVAARAQTKDALARSLVWPLDPTNPYRLSEPAAEAMWELATNPEPQLGLRFLKRAVSQPRTAAQLCAHADSALLAAVGLDANKRQDVERLFATQLDRSDLETQHKVYIGITAMKLGHLGGSTVRKVAEAFSNDVKKSEELTAHYGDLLEISRQLTGSERESLLRAGLERWLLAPKESGPTPESRAAVASLHDLAADLAKDVDRSTAARIWVRACDTADSNLLRQFADRIEPVEGATKLKRVIEEAKDFKTICALLAGVSVLRRLPNQRSVVLAGKMVRAMEQFVDEGFVGTQCELDLKDLSVLVERVSPEKAVHLMLLLDERELMLNEVDGDTFEFTVGLGSNIVETVRRLPARRAQAVLESAVDFAIQRGDFRDPSKFFGLTGPPLMVTLQKLAEALDPEIARARLAATAHPRVRRALAEGLVNGAARLKPAEAVELLKESLSKETDVSVLSVLMKGVSRAASHSCANDRARVLCPLIATLGSARARARTALERFELAEALAELAEALDALKGAKVLADRVERETDINVQVRFAQSLARLAEDLPRADAARAAQQSARRICALVEDANTTRSEPDLADARPEQTLARLLRFLEAPDAEYLALRAVQSLYKRLGDQSSASRSGEIMEEIVSTAYRVGAHHRVAIEGANFFLDALRRDTDPSRTGLAITGLTLIALRLSSERAAAIATAALRIERERNLQSDDHGLWEFIDPREANHLAWQRAVQLLSTYKASRSLPRLDFLDSTSVSERNLRALAISAAAASPSSGWLAVTLLAVGSEPSPCRLTTQQVVELLKMPTCDESQRRVLLKYLEDRYHRRFADHWELVEFATKAGLNLDFTSPPQRPVRP